MLVEEMVMSFQTGWPTMDHDQSHGKLFPFPTLHLTSIPCNLIAEKRETVWNSFFIKTLFVPSKPTLHCHLGSENIRKRETDQKLINSLEHQNPSIQKDVSQHRSTIPPTLLSPALYSYGYQRSIYPEIFSPSSESSIEQFPGNE